MGPNGCNEDKSIRAGALTAVTKRRCAAENSSAASGGPDAASSMITATLRLSETDT